MQIHNNLLNRKNGGRVPADQPSVSGFQKVWLYGMLLSFFWELPLFYLSSINRLNPRFYDIFFLIGLMIFNKNLLFRDTDNRIFSAWRNLVIWFCICAGFYCILLPLSMSMFSVLCAVRYVQGLMVIKMVLLLQLSREEMGKILSRCSFIGLTIIAVYCLFEYGSEGIREIEISPGRYVRTYGNVLFGPLSFSYFHLAQLVPLGVGVLASWILWRKKGLAGLLPVLVLCGPLFFCGSRTGGGLLLVMATLIVWRIIKTQKLGIFWIIFCGAGLLFLAWQYLPLMLEDMTTLNRYDEMEATNINSLGTRFHNWLKLANFQQYDYWGWMPFLGAGFNVAPINGGYRICYGIHNALLYPFEQSGIIGVILFLTFLVTALKTAWRTRNNNALSFGAFAYLLAAAVIGGMGAHNFWREFESGNVNTLIVLVCCLAYMPKEKGITPDENSADQ